MLSLYLHPSSDRIEWEGEQGRHRAAHRAARKCERETELVPLPRPRIDLSKIVEQFVLQRVFLERAVHDVRYREVRHRDHERRSEAAVQAGRALVPHDLRDRVGDAAVRLPPVELRRETRPDEVEGVARDARRRAGDGSRDETRRRRHDVGVFGVVSVVPPPQSRPPLPLPAWPTSSSSSDGLSLPFSTSNTTS